jgi:hypothetical protein
VPILVHPRGVPSPPPRSAADSSGLRGDEVIDFLLDRHLGALRQSLRIETAACITIPSKPKNQNRSYLARIKKACHLSGQNRSPLSK